MNKHFDIKKTTTKTLVNQSLPTRWKCSTVFEKRGRKEEERKYKLVEIRKVEGKNKQHRNKDKTGRSNKQYGKYC